MRKSSHYVASDLQDFITRYNPLALRDSECMLLAYDYYSDCYSEFFERVYRLFPMGYVDYVVLLIEHFGMEHSEASHEVGLLIGKGMIKRDPEIIVWEDSPETTRFLRGLLQGVSFITECPYKEDSFMLAKEKFFKIKRDVNHE